MYVHVYLTCCLASVLAVKTKRLVVPGPVWQEHFVLFYCSRTASILQQFLLITCVASLAVNQNVGWLDRVILPFTILCNTSV